MEIKKQTPEHQTQRAGTRLGELSESSERGHEHKQKAGKPLRERFPLEGCSDVVM